MQYRQHEITCIYHCGIVIHGNDLSCHVRVPLADRFYDSLMLGITLEGIVVARHSFKISKTKPGNLLAGSEFVSIAETAEPSTARSDELDHRLT